MSLSTELIEQQLWGQIREIQDRYRQELEPFIKRLADIQAMKPQPPLIMDMNNLPEWQKQEIFRRIKDSGALDQ